MSFNVISESIKSDNFGHDILSDQHFGEKQNEKVEATVDCIRAAGIEDLGIAKLSFNPVRPGLS